MNITEPINISSESFDAAVAKSPVPVLVDFWAPWCGPCKMIAPVLDEIARERAGAARVAKVNTEDDPQLAARFGVRAIPTLLLFYGGELKEAIVGSRVTKKDLLAKLDALSTAASAA